MMDDPTEVEVMPPESSAIQDLPGRNLIRRPRTPRSLPGSPAWPTDDAIWSALVAQCGVLGLAATDLWVEESALSKWIAERPEFAEEYRHLEQSSDLSMTKHVRRGCVAGETGLMWLRQAQLKQHTEGHAGSADGPRPVDFTREFESPVELSREELLAVLRREALGRRLGALDVCPVCGRGPEKPQSSGIVEDLQPTPAPLPTARGNGGAGEAVV